MSGIFCQTEELIPICIDPMLEELGTCVSYIIASYFDLWYEDGSWGIIGLFL